MSGKPSETILFEKVYIKIYELVVNLNKYYPNNGCAIIIDLYNKLDISMVLVKFLKIMEKHHALLKNKHDLDDEDEQAIFGTDLIILPDVNLKHIWPQLSVAQKNKIWVQLRLIYLTGMHVLATETPTIINKKSTVVAQVEPEPSTIDRSNFYVDPIKGVGQNVENYDTTALLKSTELLGSAGPKEFDVETVMSMLKLDKYIDLDKMTDQLKNMSSEDVEAATSSIQSMLVVKDENTQNFLGNLFSNIKNELNDADFSEGGTNKMKQFMAIAGRIADDLRPQIENKNIDAKSILNNATGLIKQMASNNVQDEGQKKQLDAVGKIIDDMQKNPRKLDKKYLDNAFKQMNVDPKQMRNMMKGFKK